MCGCVQSIFTMGRRRVAKDADAEAWRAFESVYTPGRSLEQIT